jgi:uncharacterized Zn finger protein (UPF0148 family)
MADYVKGICPNCGERFGAGFPKGKEVVCCPACGQEMLVKDCRIEPKPGLPGSLKRAMSDDKAGVVCCPVCGGTGKVDPRDEPKLKAAWEAANEDVVRHAVREIVTKALTAMPNPQIELHRRYRMTQQMLKSQRRVKDFTQAAAALRYVSGTDVASYILRNTTIMERGSEKELIIDVLFRSQAAVKEGLCLFDMPLEEVTKETKEIITVEEIERLIGRRNKARVEKDYVEAGTIRRTLDDMGIVLEVGPTGTTWKGKPFNNDGEGEADNG